MSTRRQIRHGDKFVHPYNGKRGLNPSFFVFGSAIRKGALVIEMRPMGDASPADHLRVPLGDLLEAWTLEEANDTGSVVWTEPKEGRA